MDKSSLGSTESRGSLSINLPRKSSSRSPSPPNSYNRMGFKNDSSDKPTQPVQNIDLFGKTGGAYIPPARLRQMQAKITDKNTDAYQRIAWEALKKSIHGLINKVNVSNISQVVRQLFMENIIRGRGLLVKSLITSQTASPTFTHIFAALIAIVNTKFPQIGELLLKRLITEFRKAFRRNQKDRCLAVGRFLAHLVNQKVAHEIIVLELLTLLLEQTTNDSVEVSVALLKECGAFLSRVVPKGLAGIFDHLRRILNESECDKRISYMIEVLLQIRRDKWRDYPTVLPELDLIEEDDQITHTLSLLDQVETDDALNIYHFDPEYEAHEIKYTEIRESFLGDDNSIESGGSGSDDEESDEEADIQGPGEQEGGVIIDQTETNLVHLRRTIYLMLQSSISADEGAHRLLQLKIKPGEEYEVASMVLDCCAQTRSYETRYGSLAQRLCRVMLFSGDKPKPGETAKPSEPSEPPRTYVAQFEKIFGEQYATIHRLETSKLKNVAMFFAHLLFTDSISWGVLECVKLNERDTSSSGRIFLKYLFQELCSFMGLTKLQARLRDETLQPFFAHLLPRDNPKDTRFAINFLTTIGLGGLTIDLREHLQATKAAGDKVKFAEGDDGSPSSSDSDSTSSSSDSSDSESSSGSSSSSSSSSSSASSGEESARRKSKKWGNNRSNSVQGVESLIIPSQNGDGRSKRRGREPSPVVEKRRRYNSPSPASTYRQLDLPPRRKASPSLEPSLSKSDFSNTSGRWKGTPPTPHRDRRPDVSREQVVNSISRDPPTPPRRSRYFSPSPLPSRRIETPPVRKNRYGSPPIVPEGVKESHSWEVSKELNSNSGRRGVEVLPPSRAARKPHHRRDISKERDSESRRHRDGSRDFDKRGNQRRHERKRSPSPDERKMRNASPPSRPSSRDRSPFKARMALRRSPNTSR